MIRRVLRRIKLVALTAALLAPSVARAQNPGDLTEVYSTAGVLSVTLVAAGGKVHLGDLEVDGFIFNDNYAGPGAACSSG